MVLLRNPRECTTQAGNFVVYLPLSIAWPRVARANRIPEVSDTCLMCVIAQSCISVSPPLLPAEVDEYSPV
ncbi:hypothetical protein AVEN_146273-1, partial [Araneus ventricosus]